MNNPLFAPGSALGNAFNDIFTTDASNAKTDKRVDAAVPAQASPDAKKTCPDVA